MADSQVFISDQDILLRDFLKQRLSQKALKRAKMQGDILVNGHHQTVRYMLHVGDKVEVYYPEERSTLTPWAFYLHIVYEDDDLMIIDKQAGIPSIASKGYPTHSLANIITNYYQENDIKAKVHLVSRLDKDTSGLLMVAKSSRIHDLMTGQVKRQYLLLCEGKLDKPQGTIRLSIDRRQDSIKRGVYSDGKVAITHYQVLETYPTMSLVKAQLETGRAHQIRVHFSHLGHPLVGDGLYGHKKEGFVGQALHSCTIDFIHPTTKKSYHFESNPLWLGRL